MGSLCSTIYDDIADPSEGQFMWQPKNGKRVNYYRKSKIYKRNSVGIVRLSEDKGTGKAKL
jgi:hypothetical protein